MQTLELPLVIFTLLTQVAVGMVLFAALRQWASVEGPSIKTRNEWIAILALLFVAVAAAFFHLGKPLGAVRMLANLSTAWLSREILSFAGFGVLAAVTFYTVFNKKANGWLMKLTALVGLIAVVATGLTYASDGLDAIHNALPLVFFLLTVFVLGPAMAMFFVDKPAYDLLRSILEPALWASLAVRVTVPFIWLSGGTVMAQTGQNFLASPLHWLHMAILLAAAALLRRMKVIPLWLPVLLLLGELLGRLAFFALVTASGANLGGVY
jgi:DMSO reductase anchor subunit